MTSAGWVALSLTLVGALSYATASILQAVGARRSVGTVRTMAHPLYLLGIGFDIVAWVGAMIALRELAVYVVESVLAGSLALTVLGARLFLGSRLRRRDAAAIVVTMAALAVLALSAGPQAPVATTGTLRWALCAGAFAMVLTGWAAARAGLPGGGVAALAGLSLGGAALVGRSLPLPADGSGWTTALALVTEPLTLALLVFAVTGMTLYAHALQHGEVGPVTAVHWAFEVIAPSAVAVVLLGDTVRPGWGPAALAAGLVTVSAAVVLACAPANHAVVAAEKGAAPEPTAPALPAAPVPALPAVLEPALPAAPEPALPAALEPALSAGPAPVAAPPNDRVIWWGPPPVWTPPSRPAVALPAGPAVPALGWEAPPRVQAAWADPQRPDADVTAVPFARRSASARAWAAADLAGTEPTEPRWSAPMWADAAPGHPRPAA